MTTPDLADLLRKARSILSDPSVKEKLGISTPPDRKVRSKNVRANELDLAPIVIDYDDTRCPHCGGSNRGEHILNITRTLHWFCKDCWSSWPEQGIRHFVDCELHDKVCWQRAVEVS